MEEKGLVDTEVVFQDSHEVEAGPGSATRLHQVADLVDASRAKPR